MRPALPTNPTVFTGGHHGQTASTQHTVATCRRCQRDPPRWPVPRNPPGLDGRASLRVVPKMPERENMASEGSAASGHQLKREAKLVAHDKDGHLRGGLREVAIRSLLRWSWDRCTQPKDRARPQLGSDPRSDCGLFSNGCGGVLVGAYCGSSEPRQADQCMAMASD